MRLADLKIPPREAGYARGKDVYEQILRAAFNVLVEHGAGALTMRRVAAECGTQSGNLQYYFRTKSELISDLINAILESYKEALDLIVYDSKSTPEVRLERFIILILDDISTKETTRIFPELWVLANRDAFVQARVEQFYVKSREYIAELVGRINPSLPKADKEILVVFISSSLEGLTIFCGYDKPWHHKLKSLEAISIISLVSLVRNLKPGQISEFTKERAG